jgi:ABC-type glycerol-3-phosphate transport system substrate-binding protein
MASGRWNRRHFVGAAGAVAAGFGATGMGTSEAVAAPHSAAAKRPPRRAQGEPVRLQFAHMNSWNPPWAADLDAMVADWNAANPGVQVDVIKWTWDTYFATMTAAIGAEQAPDVMNIGWGEVVQIGRLHLLDLAPMLTDEDRAGFSEASFRSCTFEDAVYGLPVFEQMNQVLYYRDDFAQEAGVSFEGETLDWAGLIDAAKKLTSEGRFGLGANGMGRGIVEVFAPFQYQNDSPMVARDGDGWVSTFDTEESTEAARYFIDLWTTEQVINPNSLGKGYTDLVTDLGLGTIGMFHGVTQNYFAVGEQFPDLKDVVKIAPPQTNRSTATIGGAFSMSVFKTSEHPEEAVDFVKFATSADSMAKYWLPKGQVLSSRPEVPSPGMPDDIAERMREYQSVQQVFPFTAKWETMREGVLAPRLALMASGQAGFDEGWADIQEEAAAELVDAE